MEVDAFLIFVLSGYLVPSIGYWVLSIGVARYAFVAAGWVLPWLRRPLPLRYWRKVVAATVGIVFTCAVAQLLPQPGPRLRWFCHSRCWPSRSVATCSGRGAVETMFRRRSARSRPCCRDWCSMASSIEDELRSNPTPSPSSPIRRSVIVGAAAAGWLRSRSPCQHSRSCGSPWSRRTTPPAVTLRVRPHSDRGPTTARADSGVAARPARVLAIVVGSLLGVLTVVKILDIGFLTTLDRPFDPVSDWSYLGPAVGLLDDSIGRTGAVVSVIAAALMIVAIIVLMPMAVAASPGSECGTAAPGAGRGRPAHRLARRGVFGRQIVPGPPIASSSAAELAADQVTAIRDGVKDQHTFADTISHDPLSITPAADLLTGLRGKDVLVVFVESYGRVAVQNSAFSPGVDAVLDAGTSALHAAGFSAESAFLTSPTFGGISWLAHSTLQSGLWIDNQLRYNQLVASNRFTLSDAFSRAGWRTVGDVPSNGDAWPQGTAFYHYDQTYGDHDVGYRGPSFSYASMPDQYILSAFQRLELAKPDHAPVMAEIDLVSSHTPWAPLPQLVPWRAVGDGSIFAGMPAEGRSPSVLWKSADQVRAAYGQSIEYRLNTLVSFVQTYPDPNLVLVVLGDHQPAKIVSGEGSTHNVPDLDHRARSGRAGPDCELGLAARTAAGPRGAGVAHGRLSQPLPRCLPVSPRVSDPDLHDSRHRWHRQP